MTALTYSYQVTSYDAATQTATTVYTPSINTLPTITLSVNFPPTATTQQMQIAISEKAPFEQWWAIDPSTKPVPTPGTWIVYT